MLSGPKSPQPTINLCWACVCRNPAGEKGSDFLLANGKRRDTIRSSRVTQGSDMVCPTCGRDSEVLLVSHMVGLPFLKNR